MLQKILCTGLLATFLSATTMSSALSAQGVIAKGLNVEKLSQLFREQGKKHGVTIQSLLDNLGGSNEAYSKLLLDRGVNTVFFVCQEPNRSGEPGKQNSLFSDITFDLIQKNIERGLIEHVITDNDILEDRKQQRRTGKVETAVEFTHAISNGNIIRLTSDNVVDVSKRLSTQSPTPLTQKLIDEVVARYRLTCGGIG